MNSLQNHRLGGVFCKDGWQVWRAHHDKQVLLAAWRGPEYLRDDGQRAECSA
jgi:hypothetical protein